jgi:uncharacterized protein YggE
MSVFSQDKSLSDCCARNERSLAELDKVLQKYNLPTECIQRSHLLFDQTYSYGFSLLFSSGSFASGSGAERGGKFAGYKINRRIAVILDTENKARSLIEDATRISDVNLHTIAFETTVLDKLKMTARLQALNNCREQAVQLAHQLGMSLGKPIDIGESNIGVEYVTDLPRENTYHRQGLPGSSANTTIYEIGKIVVCAEMTGTFELVETQSSTPAISLQS